MSVINFEIKLGRENKIYYENEFLTGCVQFNCPSEAKHDGITLFLEGIVNLQLSTKNIGLFDAFYNSVKPITLLNRVLELAVPGKLSAGISEFHFELPLVCKKEPRILYETYHGVFININYQLRCDVKRSFLSKSLQKVQQFCIQYKPTKTKLTKTSAPILENNNKDKEGKENGATVFTIGPETSQKSTKERIAIPRFLITGKLDATECCITRPLSGHVVVHHTEVAIKSIELQLIRVETCGCSEGYSKDATEVQTIQIADGNISSNMEIPIYMVLPRLFTCPTLLTKNFKIEFELNIIAVFKDDYMASVNFPIVIKRTQSPEEQKFISHVF